MQDGDKEDYDFLTAHEIEHTKGTADCLPSSLADLDPGRSGYQITRLRHSLQPAPRPIRDVARPARLAPPKWPQTWPGDPPGNL